MSSAHALTGLFFARQGHSLGTAAARPESITVVGGSFRGTLELCTYFLELVRVVQAISVKQTGSLILKSVGICA